MTDGDLRNFGVVVEDCLSFADSTGCPPNGRRHGGWDVGKVRRTLNNGGGKLKKLNVESEVKK